MLAPTSNPTSMLALKMKSQLHASPPAFSSLLGSGLTRSDYYQYGKASGHRVLIDCDGNSEVSLEGKSRQIQPIKASNKR